jgi:amidase
MFRQHKVKVRRATRRDESQRFQTREQRTKALLGLGGVLCIVLGLIQFCVAVVWPDRTSATASSAPYYNDIATLHQQLAQGKLSVHQLTTEFIGRIHALDQAGPAIHSIIELNPDALAIADKLDSDSAHGSLYGMPILIKDNIDTGDRMLTSVGSLAFTESAPKDAELVARLRRAGAVILGKTNPSEWVNFRSSHGISGWSARGGQTHNPYVLDRTPCSSSAGSAAAVAAGFAVAAIGTETDGSILCPASMNGIVGIKPTLGLVSRAGLVPLSPSQDTAGPMARSVTDAVTLLCAIVGSDPRDPATAEAGQHAVNYGRFLQIDGLKGKRIGVVRQLAGRDPNADRVLEHAIALMKQQGAIIVDPVELPHVNELSELEGIVLRYEFKDSINAYLADHPKLKVRSLADVIAFNQREASREMQWFAQELLDQAQAKGPLTDRVYIDAQAKAKRLSGPEGIDAAMSTHHLDALLAPTWGPAFVIDPVLGDPAIRDPSQPAAMAGYPSITVPAGLAHDLPVGIIFFGAKWSEPTLISIAYGFEQYAHAWQPPQFLETVGGKAVTAPEIGIVREKSPSNESRIDK